MRILLAFCGLLILSSCAMAPPIAAIEGVSAVTTGKPLSDHLVSYSSGKNCSSVRKSTGRSYCEEEELNPTPKVWCYRTIGSISCYDRPAPYGGSQRKVGDNSHNTIKQ